MKVFVYEYCCCHVLEPDQTSLLTEGQAMLAVALQDLQTIPDVEVETMLAADLFARVPFDFHPCTADNEEPLFRRLAHEADFTLVIAPEFDNLLAERCRWVEEEGGKLLGPSSHDVRLTGDKFELARHLTQHGVATPATVLLEGAPLPRFPVVVKPRRGAGSQATFLVRKDNEFHASAASESILQPFVPGQPVSCTALLGESSKILLAPCSQRLSQDGCFQYLGGTLPLPAPLAERTRRLTRTALETLPSLRGSVGVDLILGEAADGSGDCVIEINPRLTTSYVGLTILAKGNLMELLLRVVRGESVEEPNWEEGEIEFDANGNWRRCKT